MKSKNSKRSKEDANYKTMSSGMRNADFKFEVPLSCHVSMMKKVLIEKMQAKYFLASHPYPKIEGEMVIFKPHKAD